ncbi:hypothetical protein AB0H34_38425 [Saccharopolyspora shandongensis]|uniref:hypothetical protein n=1 Tax=Saccharopolyspora shandongensis TaxID=418495 RepID=UPI0033D934C4
MIEFILGIRTPLSSWQQAQHGERVGHTQVGQPQQHGQSSCCVDRQPRESADSSGAGRH